MANPPGTTTIPPGADSITILAIDGCGIQDVIPATILSFLESELQALDGEGARLADYFDIVAGTNTGGLMTAMLTTPDENSRPLFAAKDIKDFYINHASESIQQLRHSNTAWPHSSVRKLTKLDKLIKEKFGNTKLHQTLTNVVIPAFDLNSHDPTMFSSYKVEDDPTLDAMLSDICIATLPVPACLQAHSFTIKDGAGNAIREHKIIDGGVAVNNLALLAMRELVLGRSNFQSRCVYSDPKFLVLSLGSGSKKLRKSTDELTWWNKKDWDIKSGYMYARGYASSLDSDLNVLFKFLYAECNYLHIQDDTLDEIVSSVDMAPKAILDGLVKVGDGLLKKMVSKVGLEEDLFKLKHPGGVSNADSLKRFAKLLSNEKRRRRNQNTGNENAATSNVAFVLLFPIRLLKLVVALARLVIYVARP